MRITRKRLIEIAVECLNEFEGKLSPEDVGHLLDAAYKMKKVALGEWSIDEKCGCLVGTARMAQGLPAEPNDFGSLWACGCKFDDKLRLEGPSPERGIVEVVD